jgi:hypothetical protein
MIPVVPFLEAANDDSNHPDMAPEDDFGDGCVVTSGGCWEGDVLWEVERHCERVPAEERGLCPLVVVVNVKNET